MKLLVRIQLLHGLRNTRGHLAHQKRNDKYYKARLNDEFLGALQEASV